VENAGIERSGVNDKKGSELVYGPNRDYNAAFDITLSCLVNTSMAIIFFNIRYDAKNDVSISKHLFLTYSLLTAIHMLQLSKALF